MYEFLAQLAQTWGLVLFVLAFILVLFYALLPSRGKLFEQASRIPLNEEEPDHD